MASRQELPRRAALSTGCSFQHVPMESRLALAVSTLPLSSPLWPGGPWAHSLSSAIHLQTGQKKALFSKWSLVFVLFLSSTSCQEPV